MEGGNTLYGLLQEQLLALRLNYGALKNAAAAAANNGVRQPIIILSKALIDFSIGGFYCRRKTCINAGFYWHNPLPVGWTSGSRRKGGNPADQG